MAVLIPIAVLILIIVALAYRRRGKGGSGLGDRSDAEERPELRGTEQWKNRQPQG